MVLLFLLFVGAVVVVVVALAPVVSEVGGSIRNGFQMVPVRNLAVEFALYGFHADM